MLPDAGPHAAFIWAAYAVAFLVFAGLTLAAAIASRAQKRVLGRLQPGGTDRAR